MHPDSSVNSSPTSGTPGFDPQAARHWLETLHGTSDGLIHICSTDSWTGRTFRADQLNEAVCYADNLDSDGAEGIYVRTTTLANPLGPGQRGSVKDSLALPGFAMDIDLAGPGHKTSLLLPGSVEMAQQIVSEAGLPEPTLWVHSGGGVYPWWLLEQPIDISDPEDRDLAQHVAKSIQTLIKASADRNGVHFGTGVIDLARVLRLPGSINRKEGLARPCRVIEPAPYIFYDYAALAGDVLAKAAVLVEAQAARTEQPHRPAGDSTGDRPGDAMEAAWGWEDILGAHGWKKLRRMGRGWAWQRPGKEGLGLSATTGMAPDRDRLFVFSTEAHPFACSFDVGPYTKFAAYTFLEHAGNFSAAGGALRKLGFGGQRTAQQNPSDFSDVVRPKGTGQPAAEVEVVGSQEMEPVEQVGTTLSPVEIVHSKPQISLGSEPESIMAISAVINMGKIPNVYVRDGELVHLERKSGSREGAISVTPINADRLNRLLAFHTNTVKWTKPDKQGKSEPYDASPAMTVLRAVVSTDQWDGVPPLHGVIGVPTLRPDGTLIQATGYDQATGLYLQPTTKIAHVPDVITEEQVRKSREFVFSKVFGEFCWASPGDFANYIGLLISPMLRPYVKTTTPFGLITATTRGSGKTNLSDAIGMVYGQSSQAWPARSEELQKKITSILVGNSSPVIVFDNLVQGTSVRSEILATLVTKDDWDDRLLGASQNIQARNDRLWLATGNGLTVGGDMASRTVLVRLDPRMERPEFRQFELGQFSDWIREEDNRAELIFHLIVLVRAWMQAGASRDTTHTMRGFTRWAQIVGGVLALHGLTGFLGNTDELAARDTDEEEWASFLAKWHEVFGPTPKTSKELHVSAQVDFVMGTQVDRWARCFITDDQGATPNPKSLAMMLFGKMDRIFGPYTLRRGHRTADNTTTWWVEKE